MAAERAASVRPPRRSARRAYRFEFERAAVTFEADTAYTNALAAAQARGYSRAHGPRRGQRADAGPPSPRRRRRQRARPAARLGEPRPAGERRGARLGGCDHGGAGRAGADGTSGRRAVDRARRHARRRTGNGGRDTARHAAAGRRRRRRTCGRRSRRSRWRGGCCSPRPRSPSAGTSEIRRRGAGHPPEHRRRDSAAALQPESRHDPARAGRNATGRRPRSRSPGSRARSRSPRRAASSRSRATGSSRSEQLVASANSVAQLSLLAYREGASALPSVLEAQRIAREALVPVRG